MIINLLKYYCNYHENWSLVKIIASILSPYYIYHVRYKNKNYAKKSLWSKNTKMIIKFAK